MKKNYFTFLLLSISFLTYAQGPEFTIDFEGTDPLNNLPAGVTHVHASGDVTILNGTVQVISQVNSTIIDDSGNKRLSMDYQGHLIFDETAIGTESFTIGGYYDGKENTVQWTGFLTITGNDGTDWVTRRLQHQFANGAMNGFSFSAPSGTFPTNASELSHFFFTFDADTGINKLYKNGVLVGTSSNSNNSVATWTSKKLYLGFKGGTQNQTTGDWDTAGVAGNGRNTDVRKTVDDISVFKRAISDAEALSFFTNGTLSNDNKALEIFSTYPNPVNDRLYFSSKNVYAVDIYNILGSKISSQVVNDGADMSNLNKGIYMVNLKDENGSVLQTVKAVKK